MNAGQEPSIDSLNWFMLCRSPAMPGDAAAVSAPTAASPGEAGLPGWDVCLDGIRVIAVE
jgi:hypothetical protein